MRKKRQENGTERIGQSGITKITRQDNEKLILAVDKITTKITKPKNEWILESLNFFNR